MQLTESDSVIGNLTFTGRESRGVLVHGGGPTFEGNRFVDVGAPFRAGDSPCLSAHCESLMIEGGATATVRGNELVDGGALAVGSGAAALIEGNHLTGGPFIWLWEAADGTSVLDNIIEGALQVSIVVWAGGSPTITGNIIRDSASTGIQIRAGSPLVEGNEVVGPDTYDGIAVWGPATGTSLVGNRLIDTRNAVTWNAPEGTIEGNTITGGTGGLTIVAGSPTVSENSIKDVDGPGLFVGIDSAPILRGNVSCGNATNLLIAEPASPVIDKTNEICEDAPLATTE